MITVIFSTREPNPKHVEHIKKSSGLHNKIEVLEFINNNDSNSKYYNGGESLTKLYNRGLKQAKNDIVVFCHDDITIETKQWGVKLEKQFKKNPEYGIIGVAGSKYMPASGQWWENPKKMYGRVQHTHEGRTWLSSYSDDLGQNLEETVNVDGVFFAIDKTKIKETFNESVEGFHFYEITFCFENYLKDVKIGVSTLVRVNHQSIGMTNEEWEKNRANFAETFKENLPVNIKRVLHKNEKLKILFGSISLNQNTIREKIMVEVAIKLKKLGHDITIASNLGGPLDIKCKQNGIKLASIQEPPGFKLGDGKWIVKTPSGEVPSIDKTLYKMKNTFYDVSHVFNDELIDHFIKLYGEQVLINNKFVDGLFVQDIQNESVSKTIEMKSDLDEINKVGFIDEILKSYSEAL